MPERFLSYHNAHASVFEFYHSPERPGGPGRTVYTDPRLEVAGAELFERYQELGKQIADDKPGWECELEQIGRPSIMVDHQDNAQIGATLLASRHWKCVWFDPIVAVFVHDSYAERGGQRTRSTSPPATSGPTRPPSLTACRHSWPRRRACATTRISRSSAGTSRGRSIWLGLDYARRIVEADPDSAEGWKAIAQIESNRDPIAQPTPRFRMAVRSGLRPLPGPRHLRLPACPRAGPARLHGDHGPAEGLRGPPDARGHAAPARPARRGPADQPAPADAAGRRRDGPGAAAAGAGAAPRETWKNLAELDQIVTEQLAAGRAERRRRAPREGVSRGEGPLGRRRPDGDLAPASGRAREGEGALEGAASVPSPAVRDARIGVGLSGRGAIRRGRGRISSRLSRPNPTCSRPATAWPSSSRTPAAHRPRTSMPAPRSSRPRPTSPARRLAPWLPVSPSSPARKRAGR